MVVIPPAKYHTFWLMSVSHGGGRVTDCGKIVYPQWREMTEDQAATSREQCNKCYRLTVHALWLNP